VYSTYLIAVGADVTYAFPDDNAGVVLYLLAYGFQRNPEGYYLEGDCILTADLLIKAGAPTGKECNTVSTEKRTRHQTNTGTE
jgi:hypothetical protein